MRNRWWAKVLRVVGIIFMSLTAVFTLMGGAGTTCVALDPTGFEGKFQGIAPYQWLWVIFVLVGIAAGVMGIRAVVLLIKGTTSAYRATLVALLTGTGINLIHLIASRLLRGSSMPVDMVLYMNVLTLILFLIFRLPGIKQGLDYTKPEISSKVGKQAASISLIVVGILATTIQFFMAPTHTIGSINYADVWHIVLTSLGLLLTLLGLGSLLVLSVRQPAHRRVQTEVPQ